MPLKFYARCNDAVCVACCNALQTKYSIVSCCCNAMLQFILYHSHFSFLSFTASSPLVSDQVKNWAVANGSGIVAQLEWIGCFIGTTTVPYFKNKLLSSRIKEIGEQNLLLLLYGIMLHCITGWRWRMNVASMDSGWNVTAAWLILSGFKPDLLNLIMELFEAWSLLCFNIPTGKHPFINLLWTIIWWWHSISSNHFLKHFSIGHWYIGNLPYARINQQFGKWKHAVDQPTNLAIAEHFPQHHSKGPNIRLSGEFAIFKHFRCTPSNWHCLAIRFVVSLLHGSCHSKI